MKKLSCLILMLLTMMMFGQTTYLKLDRISGGTDSVKLSDISRMYFANVVADTTPVSGTYALVQGSTFVMGDQIYGTPLHVVTLSNYYIGKTEVTQGQWKAIMGVGSNPSFFTAIGDNGPVEEVNWLDCVTYCNKLSIKEGRTPCYNIGGETNPSLWISGTVVCDFSAKGYRLPTEAEWEFAAKGGNRGSGHIYSGSDIEGSVSWCKNNSLNSSHVVGTKMANELGVYDMSGNLWEWCSDWLEPYPSSAQTNPVGPLSGSHRVMRGGSWNDGQPNDLPGYRSQSLPDTKTAFYGFRVVRAQ